MTTTNTKERAALAALILHVTGSLGSREGNPYGHRVVREAIEALHPGTEWNRQDIDDTRAVAVYCGKEVLSLVVKGDCIDVQEAANSRKIPAVEVVATAATGNAILHAPIEYEEEVARWFSEGRQTPPFPAGALISYRRVSSKFWLA